MDEFIVLTEKQPEGLLHPDTMIPIVTDEGNVLKSQTACGSASVC